MSGFIFLNCMLHADSTTERVRLKEFDLNSTYSDTEKFMEVNENSPSPANLGTGSPPSCLLPVSLQSSPPQMSANSDSPSAQSRSSSDGDAQVCADAFYCFVLCMMYFTFLTFLVHNIA